MTTPGKWWQDGFFGLHFDLHARATDTELGAGLTHEHLRTELTKVRPDFVQCDCKGHPGWTSYPTKVGSPSPGIVRDALRIHRDVTAELGIPLSVHYSGIWDARALELHPDWAAMGPDGHPQCPRDDKPGIVCPRGPYLDELMIPQLLEIVDEYDVDGFWVDGDNWAVRDCYCDRCRAAFAAAHDGAAAPTDTADPAWRAWRAFQRDSFVAYVTRYANAVHERKPSCAVCSNWMYTMRQPGPVVAPVDYLSGDFTSSFGCERAEMEGRYMDGHDLPWNLMAWSFCSPDMKNVRYQMKTTPHLCQEAAEVMSCGGAVFIYGRVARDGHLPSWHMDMFADVAAFCRARQPWVHNSVLDPEAVVYLSDEHIHAESPFPFCLGDSYHSLDGALHALIENQVHTDVLDRTRLLARLDDYGLVVVGEQTHTAPEVLAALERYVEAGGCLLMSGAHLADQCPELVGVEPVDDARDTPWHVPVDGATILLGSPWRPVRTTTAAALVAVHHAQEPDRDATEFPAVTRRRLGKGTIVAVHGNLMGSYHGTHHPRIRRFVARLLDDLGWDRRLKVTAPPNVEVALRRQSNRHCVHLVNRAVNPTLTAGLHIVEDVPVTGPIEIVLKQPRPPLDVRCQPGDRDIPWAWEDGLLTCRLETLHIHDIVVVDNG